MDAKGLERLKNAVRDKNKKIVKNALEGGKNFKVMTISESTVRNLEIKPTLIQGE